MQMNNKRKEARTDLPRYRGRTTWDQVSLKQTTKQLRSKYKQQLYKAIKSGIDLVDMGDPILIGTFHLDFQF